jgi:hypothetical protein
MVRLLSSAALTLGVFTSGTMAATTLQEMAASGGVYGYQDPANCVTWSVRAKFPNGLMYYTAPAPAQQASTVLVGQALGGLTGWRLPTLDEFQSFYSAVGAQGMTGGSFQARDWANGSLVARAFDVGTPPLVQYWSSNVVGAVVYGYAAGNGGIVPHSYSGGAKLYVWAVRSSDTPCASALVSPFVAAPK